MLHIFETGGRPAEGAVLAAMFEARKRVFVDLLGWDVPVLAGRFEMDQFDDSQACYLVLTDGAGEHLGWRACSRRPGRIFSAISIPACARRRRHAAPPSSKSRAFASTGACAPPSGC